MYRYMNRTSVIKCVVLQCIVYAFYMYIQQHTWVKWNISFSFCNFSCSIQLCSNYDLPLHDLPIPKIQISWIEKIWYWLTQNFYIFSLVLLVHIFCCFLYEYLEEFTLLSSELILFTAWLQRILAGDSCSSGWGEYLYG